MEGWLGGKDGSCRHCQTKVTDLQSDIAGVFFFFFWREKEFTLQAV